MTTTIIVPLLVCIIGLLTYALASNGKAAEAGRIAYFVGLLWCVYQVAGHVVRLGV